MNGVINGGSEPNLLARCIEERMAELDLTPTDLARETGLTLQALANVRKGLRRNYQRRLTMPLTRVLGWSPDSIQRAMNGQSPVVEVANPRPQPPSRLEARLAALEEAVETAVPRLLALAGEVDESRSRISALEKLAAETTRRRARQADA